MYTKKSLHQPHTPHHGTPTPCAMRVVDMTNHQVVKCGIVWPYSSTPNCKRMITQLERNEALVTWIKPTGGDVTDQFPAIRVKDQYYTMSLRMMKVGVLYSKTVFISITQPTTRRQCGAMCG